MKMEINRRWFGVLNLENLDAVAEVMRKILAGRIAIAEASYVDSGHAQLRLISADCQIDSRWTSEPSKESVRVFRGEDGHAWIGFSAGGFFWSFTARPDNGSEHDDYRYPFFSFEYNKFTVTDRAPAGKGYLHQRAFGAHEKTK